MSDTVIERVAFRIFGKDATRTGRGSLDGATRDPEHLPGPHGDHVDAGNPENTVGRLKDGIPLGRGKYGDDCAYSLSTSATSIEEGIGRWVGSITRDRVKNEGWGWTPKTAEGGAA